jgi:DHA2 family methylenomycin A resistance protein-like MFS transporter
MTATLAPPRTRPLILLGISIGYGLTILDSTIMAAAEADLINTFGAGTTSLQWTVAAYTVVLGAFLLTAGAAVDRFGAHRVFRAGVLAFGLLSLAGALAPNLAALTGVRALMGLAAAACMPASMSLITQLYADPRRRAGAIGAWAAISGGAMAAGPLVGGAVVAVAGWQGIFWINVPLAAATLALTASPALHGSRTDRPIDWASQLSACAALGLGIDALIALGSGAAGHAAGSAVAAALATALFARLERRSKSPVLNPAVLRAGNVGPALLAGGAVNFALSGTLFVLPLYFQRTLDLDALRTGLAFVPMTAAFGFLPILTGKIVARTGPRRPILVGLALLATGATGLAATTATGAPLVLTLVASACLGVGVTFAIPAHIALVTGAAPAGTAGAAGGFFNATRMIAATVGVAVMGSIAGVDGGAGATASAVALAAAVCAAVLVYSAARIRTT